MSLTHMKKIKITLWTGSLVLGLFFISVPAVHAETIREFSSTINVLPDSSILVREKIVYDFEESLRHGISRSIPLTNSKKEPVQIKSLSVIGDDGNPSKFKTDIANSTMNIQIGDPDRMVSGIHEYDITYQVFGGVTYYEDFDEIYWNVTGNDWQMPIQKSEVKVILPNNVFPTRVACYYGKLDSRAGCEITESNTFVSGRELTAGEGLTIAVGFPKGIVAMYKINVETELYSNLKLFWPIIFPVVVFIYMYNRWFKKGKDETGKGVIIPQYDVPDDLTPLEVGGIVNGKVINQNISAEIIYLATKGYIKIRQIDEECDNFLCLISKKDYEFTLLKEVGLLSNIFDRKILKGIFEEEGIVGGISKLSELNNNFYKSIPDIDNAVADTLLIKKYFKNFPKLKSKDNLIFGASIFGASMFVGKFFNISNNVEDLKKLVVFIFSLALSAVIYFIFNRIMSAKSRKGAEAREYLLGLKEYLQIAEKDRLKFHNAPDKKPETFEALLPYAMVFGVEELWAREFKDIYDVQPKWYENKSSNFNIVDFGHEMSTFNALAATSFSPPHSTSGSGGGGSVGRGGGGGGGRSW